jgi:hypothetical protein
MPMSNVHVTTPTCRAVPGSTLRKPSLPACAPRRMPRDSKRPNKRFLVTHAAPQHRPS